MFNFYGVVIRRVCMHILNEVFDKIIVLTTPKRLDRRKSLDVQMEKLDVKYEYFYGTVGNPYGWIKGLSSGEVGHLCSTINIMKEIISRNYKTCLLLEDDAEFIDIDNFDFEFYEAFQQVPKGWEILYLGCNSNECSPTGKINHFVNKKIMSSLFSLTTSSYAVTLEAAKKILKELEGPPERLWTEWVSKATDMYLALMQDRGELKGYAIYPSLIGQSTSYSDIQQCVVNYKELIK